MKEYTKKQKIIYILLPFVLVPVLYFTGRILSGFARFFPPCPSYTLFKIHCPACGMTRSVTALLHGDVLLSLRQNPFIIIAIILVIAAYTEFMLRVFKKKPPFSVINNVKLTWVILILLAVFTILRNFIPAFAPL